MPGKKNLPETSPAFQRLTAALVAIVDERVAEALARPAADVVADDAPDLPVPPRKVRELAKQGAFPATKRGRRWFFRRADLLAHLVPSAAPPSADGASDAVDELAASLGLTIGGAR